MASSMLTGDRRWAPARKGMTVLGKVPKPINLPSQRLENHGLDPNVEIVPKGTLTWGSRSSSAAPNAWGSSNYSSPSTDGSVGSPSHHFGRPSSAGSGTRPSTAGSDRSYEPVTNAWSSNSRPSSASGILASTQAPLASSRPRSAETRPGSSQLSRFAEPIPENSVAWGGSRTADRLGPASSKTNNFTLSSGDFPTLGAERSSELHTQQGHSSQGTSAASCTSASERLEVPQTEHGALGVQSDKGTSNTWKMDNPPHAASGPSPNNNSWHGDPLVEQPSPNMSVPPPHANPWHGPRNPADGVWFRGPSPPGSYGQSTGPPVNYPSESFVYYPAPLSARPSPNSHVGPRPGPVLGGYSHKNGEACQRSLPSDSYMGPTMPVISVRPGVYPGPVPFDGYYGPPRAGFCSSTERERPLVGMSTGPAIYNQFTNQNVHQDPGMFHARVGAHAPVANERMPHTHVHDTNGGQFRVLLKHHDGSDSKGAEHNRDHSGAIHIEKISKGKTMGEEKCGANKKSDELPKSAVGESSSPSSISEGSSQITNRANSTESNRADAGDGSWVKKWDSVSSPVDVHHHLKKNATLIEKIDCLNNKARTTDGRTEGILSAKEEKAKGSKGENLKADNLRKAMQSRSASMNKTPSENTPIGGVISALCDKSEHATGGKIPGYTNNVKVPSEQSEVNAATIGVSDGSDTNLTIQPSNQKQVQHAQGRTDYQVKSRFNGHNGEGLKKQPSGRDSSSIIKASNNYEVGHLDEHPPQELSNKQGLPYVNKVKDDTHMSHSVDSVDYVAQRAKMKEMAAQRAKELQKEEEERIKELKNKAFAKLEELNRRTMIDASNQKVDHALRPSNTGQSNQDSTVSPALKGDSSSESVDCTSGSDARTNEKDAGNHERILVQKSDVFPNKLVAPSVETSISSSKPGWATAKKSVINKQEVSNTVQVCDSDTRMITISTAVQTGDPSSVEHKESEFLDACHEGRQSVLGSGISHDPILANETGTEKFSSENLIQVHESSLSKQRQAGHRRRQNIQQEKTVPEKSVAHTIAGSSKALEEVPAGNANSCDSLPWDNGSGDSSMQHKKKNSRGVRTKSKSEHSSLISTSTTATHKEEILEKRPESTKSDPSATLNENVLAPVQSSVERMGDQNSKEAMTSSNKGWHQPSEEGHGKAANTWKPHPPKKTARNGQARPLDKFHGNEAVMWAPVRPLNKSEAAEGGQSDTNEVNCHSSGKSGMDIQSNLKFKRAEMERYTTKLVAKDASQQGNAQKPSSPLHATPLVEVTMNADIGVSHSTSDGVGPAASKLVGPAESKNWENTRPNNYGRSHVSWRQRNSHEQFSDGVKTVKRPDEPKQHLIADGSSSSHTAQSSDEWNTSCNTGLPNEPIMASEVKDQGVPIRGKRQAYRAQKTAGENYVVTDMKVLPSGTAVKSTMQSPGLDSNGLDGKNSQRSEHPNPVEHARSRWKPKSQRTNVAHSQQEQSRDSSCQTDISQGGPYDKGSAVEIVYHQQQKNVEDKNALIQGTKVLEARNNQQQQARREKKCVSGSSECQTNLSNEDSCHLVEQSSRKVEPHQGQSSRLQQQGQRSPQYNKVQEANYGQWFNKGQETNYGTGRSSGQDTSKQRLQGNGDRRRLPASHYEYQRIESHNSNKQLQQSTPVVGDAQNSSCRAAGSMYRERGQNNPRRGARFYVQNSGHSDSVGEKDSNRE